MDAERVRGLVHRPDLVERGLVGEAGRCRPGVMPWRAATASRPSMATIRCIACSGARPRSSLRCAVGQRLHPAHPARLGAEQLVAHREIGAGARRSG